MYGLTIRSIFFFLQHTRREPVYVWIAFLLCSVFVCSGLAVFAIEYDLLPHTSEPSITQGRPLIDYLYYEIITFTTVGYGDIIPAAANGKLLAICTALLGSTHGVTAVKEERQGRVPVLKLYDSFDPAVVRSATGPDPVAAN
jgi:Ion channel